MYSIVSVADKGGLSSNNNSLASMVGMTELQPSKSAANLSEAFLAEASSDGGTTVSEPAAATGSDKAKKTAAGSGAVGARKAGGAFLGGLSSASVDSASTQGKPDKGDATDFFKKLLSKK